MIVNEEEKKLWEKIYKTYEEIDEVRKKQEQKEKEKEMEIFNKNMQYFGIEPFTYDELLEIELARIGAKMQSGTMLTPAETKTYTNKALIGEKVKKNKKNK